MRSCRWPARTSHRSSSRPLGTARRFDVPFCCSGPADSGPVFPKLKRPQRAPGRAPARPAVSRARCCAMVWRWGSAAPRRIDRRRGSAAQRDSPAWTERANLSPKPVQRRSGPATGSTGWTPGDSFATALPRAVDNAPAEPYLCRPRPLVPRLDRSHVRHRRPRRPPCH